MAAPLVAGFTITLIGVVIGYSRDVRWAGGSLVLLIIAAVLLLAAVQAAFTARAWYLTPEELLAWWPEQEDRPPLATLKQWQQDHHSAHMRWAHVFQISYNVGFFVLLLALASVLAPPMSETGADRWIAAVIAAGAAMAEAGWIAFYWSRTLLSNGSE